MRIVRASELLFHEKFQSLRGPLVAVVDEIHLVTEPFIVLFQVTGTDDVRWQHFFCQCEESQKWCDKFFKQNVANLV